MADATHAMLNIFLGVLDLGGTFVFAISGALVAVRHRLDVFGVAVLAFAAGNAGGITRDLLIGTVPPAAVADWKYIGVSTIAAALTFVWHPAADRFRNDVLWCDAVGLAFFAVSGTQKALLHGLHPAMAALRAGPPVLGVEPSVRFMNRVAELRHQRRLALGRRLLRACQLRVGVAGPVRDRRVGEVELAVGQQDDEWPVDRGRTEVGGRVHRRIAVLRRRP
jgi:hypothetical protein